MIKLRITNRNANIISKSIAIFGVLLVFLMFLSEAYIHSYLNGHIDKNLFTVSQSLAFGYKPGMGIMLTLGMGILIFLNLYRGLNYLPVRIFLLFVCYALIFTIFWVTTYYSRKDHYSIATTIFICAVVYIFLNSMAIFNHGGYNTLGLVLIYLLPILSIVGFIGLSIGLIPVVFTKVPQIFPSFENFILVLVGASNLLLGFA